MTCCRLLDGQRDRCVSGQHVVGGHSYRSVRTSRVTLAAPVSSFADALRSRGAARQRPRRADATRRTISRTASRYQRVQLPGRFRQGIPVRRETVVRRRAEAALSRQGERSGSCQGRRRGTGPPARVLSAVQ